LGRTFEITDAYGGINAIKIGHISSKLTAYQDHFENIAGGIVKQVSTNMS
jgi:hypothetical protein